MPGQIVGSAAQGDCAHFPGHCGAKVCNKIEALCRTGMSAAKVMTIGELAASTGLSHKQIRELEGRGLIYSVGRSEGNYRLFDASALWCVRTIVELRGLGLTLTEIEELRDHHRSVSDRPLGQLFRDILNTVRERLVDQIADLNATVRRIDAIEDSIPGHFAVDGLLADPCLEPPSPGGAT